MKRYTQLILNILVPILMMAAVVIFVPKLIIFFIPFIIGAVIAWIANPLIRFLNNNRKLNRPPVSEIMKKAGERGQLVSHLTSRPSK